MLLPVVPCNGQRKWKYIICSINGRRVQYPVSKADQFEARGTLRLLWHVQPYPIINAYCTYSCLDLAQQCIIWGNTLYIKGMEGNYVTLLEHIYYAVQWEREKKG